MNTRASIKLVSINIERDLHLDRVVPFVIAEKPDVLCLQEVREPDVQIFAKLFSDTYVFAPAIKHRSDGFKAVIGQAVFSKLPIATQNIHYYVGDPAVIPREELPDTCGNHAVVVVEVGEEEAFRIAATHFVWSERGQATDLQRISMRKLLEILQPFGELVLCGDFNAPRGGEIFSMLLETYHDNVPPQYATSLDLDLHRAGKDRPHELADKMVDGMFSTPGYRVSHVRMVPGVSDHCALVATVQKRGELKLVY